MKFDSIRMGEKLRALRGEKTLKEVAESVGISTQALWMYESGERVPRDQVKMAIAKYYNRSIEYIFFDGTDTQSGQE